MWEWSRTVTERAVAAGWIGRGVREPQPTILDPEPWAEAQEQREQPGERSGDHRDGDMFAGASAMSSYCLAG
ncbi:hypothetical protein [Nocardia macrotermitis]|uniref:Uncharacterized protein n=1 Tax=Nocardia macrotermitis TaxID=2585198 RepID=A0A7K0DCB2_9NOCA|nr:hypothetical protein [Nocardia macrotermitis]MQY23367.1 hypothetical protein [Nocardia macrotermitis]